MIQLIVNIFWINRRDFEIETKRNWQIIFDKTYQLKNIEKN